MERMTFPKADIQKVTLPKDWLDRKIRDFANIYNSTKERASEMACPFQLPESGSAEDYTAYLQQARNWIKEHNVHWESRPWMPSSTNNPSNEALVIDGVIVGWLQAWFTEDGQFKVGFAPCRNQLIEEVAPNL